MMLNRAASALLLTAIAASALLPAPAAAQAPAPKTLRVVMHSDLKIIDPIWSASYILRQHAYLVWDTLFAIDDKFQVRPQMAEGYKVSADGLLYTITLREGLSWHDGTPVTAEDCVASLKRWAARDSIGQKLAEFVAEWKAADVRTIEIRLKEKFGPVIEALGKPSVLVPFMMPKRLAETDPFKQIPEAIGSGPFIFKADEWQPGNKVVYVRNPRYQPRAEPAAGLAGGKVAKLDRVEWLWIPDTQTQVDALLRGEIDLIENVSHDLFPLIEKSKGVRIVPSSVTNQYAFRMNWLIPPFDNIKVRQAAQMALGQQEFLEASVGNRKFWRTCKALFTCGGPYETTAGMDGLVEANAAKAQALLKDAGYTGTPVVMMHPTDVNALKNLAPVAKAQLEKAGFKVDMQAMDWQTLITRVARKGPTSQGGWNVLITNWQQIDILDPLVMTFLVARADKARAGWPEDAPMEAIRDRFARETDAARRKAIAVEAQVHNAKVVTYVPLGEWYGAAAARDNVVLPSPMPPFMVFWGLDKS
jgi:peptide/nickel transport system substrate-binding protein